MLKMRIPDDFFGYFPCWTHRTFCMGLTRNGNKVNGGISCQYLDTVYESKINIIIYDFRATDVGVNSLNDKNG
jgi:hypothetical protein